LYEVCKELEHEVECICGDINARNCPVHQQDEESAECTTVGI
jgi:hypothetical protein